MDGRGTNTFEEIHLKRRDGGPDFLIFPTHPINQGLSIGDKRDAIRDYPKYHKWFGLERRCGMIDSTSIQLSMKKSFMPLIHGFGFAGNQSYCYIVALRIRLIRIINERIIKSIFNQEELYHELSSTLCAIT